jgi:DNA-binding NtrC family response regulator/predicted ATPase
MPTVDGLTEVVGDSPAIIGLRKQVRNILRVAGGARRAAPLLLRGETGTGKGLIARIIHRTGPRASGQFVDVNCAAIPEHLLEAELFGYERGAFTDARQAKLGLFEVAHRGTLFLDEIALLPDALQAKLLKVLDDGFVRRLGATRAVAVDVWVVAATNEDLEAARQARRFREDLYHRLAVLAIDVPPLRARDGDIVLLAEHFLARSCADYGLPSVTLASDARAALLAYRWPGNVRELSNVMERAALLSEVSVITAAMLALPASEADGYGGSPAPAAPPKSLESSRDRMSTHLVEVLNATGWNITRTAAILGVARNTVSARIARYGLARGNDGSSIEQVDHRTGRKRPINGRPRRPLSVQVAVSGSTANPDLPATAPARWGDGRMEGRAPSVARGRWERRQIALLKADLGFDSGPSEALDASHQIDLILAKVQSFGGRVEELGSSAVLGVFGVEPIEDAPARAALAALAILKGVERDREIGSATPRVALAVHVDQVLIGRVDGVDRIDVTAKEAACRDLDGLTRRGQRDAILLTEDAAHQLERRFELMSVPATSEEPEAVYRLVRQEPTGFGLGGRPLTPFVGREREMAILTDRIRDVDAGHGQVVGVLGEPGVGKSRVVLELTRLNAARRWRVLSVGGLTYGTTTPFLVISDLLRYFFHIEDADEPSRVFDKVTTTLLAHHPELEADLPPLLSLLDMPVDDASWGRLDARQRKQRIVAAVKRLIVVESQRQPLLLVIEDLQWIDDATQTVLDALIDGLAAARVLLLVTYRPEYRHGWSSKTYYSQLRIDPLSSDGTDSVLRWLLGTDPTLEAVVRRLQGEVGGNPFFLEETVCALVETRALIGERGGYRLAHVPGTIRLPSSVGAVLTARIERLPIEEREFLRWAAIIGRHVPGALLRAVVARPESLRRGLERLTAAEFLYETRLVPDFEYTFKHALTHQAAYDSIPPDQRRDLHARVVDAIERTYPDRLAEHVEELAYHAVHGGLRQKAVKYLREAGRKATARSALLEARSWLEEALLALETLPESRSRLEQSFDVRLELRPVLSLLGEVRGTLSRLREAEALAGLANDDRRRSQAYALMTNTLSQVGDLDEAVSTGTRALDLARSLGDLRLRILATTYLAQAHFHRGDYERVLELVHDNRASLPEAWIYEQFGLPSPVPVYDLWYLIPTLVALGRFTEAAKYEVECIRLAEPTENAYTISGAYYTAGELRLFRGDWAKALSLIERATAVLRGGHVVLTLPLAVTASAWALAQLGETREALDRVQEGKQLLERLGAQGVVVFHGYSYVALAHACLLLGRLDEARGLAERVSSGAFEPGLVARARHVLGDIVTHPDRFDAAGGEAHYCQALVAAQQRGMRPLAAHCHLGLGKLWGRTGQRTQAREHLMSAIAMYREMEMQFWLEPAAKELEALA